MTVHPKLKFGYVVQKTPVFDPYNTEIFAFKFKDQFKEISALLYMGMMACSQIFTVGQIYKRS